MTDTVIVNGVTYVRERDTNGDTDVRIVVLQRGWVVVGRWSREGDDVTISEASVIRYWGTSKGLGELRAGPLPETTLDPAGTVRCHILTVVLTIDCDSAAWDGRL